MSHTEAIAQKLYQILTTRRMTIEDVNYLRAKGVEIPFHASTRQMVKAPKVSIRPAKLSGWKWECSCWTSGVERTWRGALRVANSHLKGHDQ